MTDFLVTETQITACAWLVKATDEEHARKVWEGSGPDVQLVDQQVTDSQGLTITEGAGGYQWPAQRAVDPWRALECAQFWLQEEAASEHPGQTKPDDILRVIGDALAGRPARADAYEIAARAAGWRDYEHGVFHPASNNYADDWRAACGVSKVGPDHPGQVEAAPASPPSVADVTLEALRLAAERIEMNNYGGEEDEALVIIRAAIAAAQGKEG